MINVDEFKSSISFELLRISRGEKRKMFLFFEKYKLNRCLFTGNTSFLIVFSSDFFFFNLLNVSDTCPWKTAKLSGEDVGAADGGLSASWHGVPSH